MLRPGISKVSFPLLLAGSAAFASACAGTESVEDDGSTVATTGQGGGSTTTGVGGMGGEGGTPNLCGQDCSTISTPDCFVSVCNEGMYPGPVGSCVVVPDADGTACDDGQFCTTADTCQAGQCTGGPPNDCGMTAPQCEEIVCDEASDACTTAPLSNGDPCTPADLCQVGATCINGLCTGGTPKDCFFQPVPNECHNSVCNPINGMCEPVPGNDGNACVDINDLCTPGKTCAAGVCSGGTPLDCSFLTAGCDLGVCDPADGMCKVQAVPNGQTCDDLSACTTGEICTNGSCGGGTSVTVCEQIGDGCCPATCNATNDLDCTIQPSCLAIKTSVPSASDGIYTIDPDGPGPSQQIQVYCDMTSDQGGWTLIARFANSDTQNWMLDTGEWWYVKTTPAGTTTSRSENADMISPAFWTVLANELRISRTDNANDAHLLMTTNNCLGNTHFRGLITSFGNFQNNVVWAADAVLGTCPASLGANYATTNGFAQATCAAGNIGAPNSISFWSDWSAGDGAVMMIGAGGTSCQRADHGIGVTEANAASFGGISASSEDDFGDNGSDSSNNNPYALNLWVR